MQHRLCSNQCVKCVHTVDNEATACPTVCSPLSTPPRLPSVCHPTVCLHFQLPLNVSLIVRTASTSSRAPAGAPQEGLAPGDVGGPEAVPENPKALISVLRKHFKGTHLKKNTYKAVNTEAGKRLRVRMSDWKCSLASVQPLLANGVPLDLAALSKLSPADGSVMTGCLQSMLRNAMCG
ncbi:hypothetical protein T492DRAFT_198834 [Pavlovales sp. CCMP2436]|nr:hypothetical protein T492DRAFT_198834 [Pavlovales sp. CCMP2436]